MAEISRTSESLIAACCCRPVTKATTEDKAPPAVVDTFPRDAPSDVSHNSLVSASFSKHMDSSTINADTFTVKNDGTTTNISWYCAFKPR